MRVRLCVAWAALLGTATAVSSPACSSGIYKDLLVLSTYPPAQSFCSAHYPLPTCTTTATATTAVTTTITTTVAVKQQRAATSSTKTSTAAAQPLAILWSSLASQATSILKTACSCIETQPPCVTVTSIRTSTKTKTKTKTTTTKSTAPPTCTAKTCNPGGCQPTFILQYTKSGTSDDGYYAFSSNVGDNDIITRSPITEATHFTFDSSCHLLGFESEIANIDAGVVSETVFFNTADQITTAGTVAATCGITGGSLHCTAGTTNIFYVCDPTPGVDGTGQLQLQIAAAVPAGCAAVTMAVTYV